MEANSGAYELLKYNQDALISKNIAQLQSERCENDMESAIQSIKNDGFSRFDCRLKTANGEDIDVDVCAKVINEKD